MEHAGTNKDYMVHVREHAQLRKQKKQIELVKIIIQKVFY